MSSSFSRFDIATAPEETPEFVLWTIPHACSLRELSDFGDPAATERLLRGLRCVSDAREEDRIVNNVAVERNPHASEPCGFSVSSVAETYGGLDFAAELCGDCPANALAEIEPRALAGCVGFLVPSAENAFHEQVDRFRRDLGSAAEIWPATNPAWYGLWIERTPGRDLLELQKQLCAWLLDDRQFPAMVGLADYKSAVEVAIERNVPLIAWAHPPGTCTGRRWQIPAHCGRCMAIWPDERLRSCKVCQQSGGRQAPRTRRRMGTRPYRKLSEFLTVEEIARIVTRRESSAGN